MSGARFECEIQARLRDVNLGGHVDNVEAVRIIDEARIQFLRYAALPEVPELPGAGLLSGVPAGVSELMGAQRVDYHAEMRFTPFQPFLVRLWLTHVGRSSFSVGTEMRVAPDHAPALVADSTLVFWDGNAQAAWAMSDDVRSALMRYLGPAVPLRSK